MDRGPVSDFVQREPIDGAVSWIPAYRAHALILDVVLPSQARGHHRTAPHRDERFVSYSVASRRRSRTLSACARYGGSRSLRSWGCPV